MIVSHLNIRGLLEETRAIYDQNCRLIVSRRIYVHVLRPRLTLIAPGCMFCLLVFPLKKTHLGFVQPIC